MAPKWSSRCLPLRIPQPLGTVNVRSYSESSSWLATPDSGDSIGYGTRICPESAGAAGGDGDRGGRRVPLKLPRPVEALPVGPGQLRPWIVRQRVGRVDLAVPFGAHVDRRR